MNSSRYREKWRHRRLELESKGLKVTPLEDRERKRLDTFHLAIIVFRFLVMLSGLYFVGRRIANQLIAREVEHFFEDLPAAFDGLRVLHLSDLHLDERPEMLDQILEQSARLSYDMVVITGDLGHATINNQDRSRQLIGQMGELKNNLHPEFGFYVVLGNHDSAQLVGPLEKMGYHLLVNQFATLEKGGERLQIIGTDDPHYFYTPAALEILTKAQEAFSIALIHSPELHAPARENGVRLYLCGHTHGGQVCLPGGIPVVRRVKFGRRFISGKWMDGDMHGYTSSGVGTSGLDVRFFTQAEIVVHVLRRK